MGVERGLGPVPTLGLGKNPVDVRLHRGLGDEEAVGATLNCSIAAPPPCEA